MTSIPPAAEPVTHLPFGLRFRLILALGALCAILVAVGAASLWGIAQMRDSAREAVEVQGRMSRLASSVALQALQCRRFEKDLFLNVADVRSRARYLADWRQANADLKTAIDQFAAAATTDQDRSRATLWTGVQRIYAAGLDDLIGHIEAGELTTTERANRSFDTYRENINTLTNLAVQVSYEKDAQAQAAAGRLAAIGGAVTWQVLIIGALALLAAAVWSLLFPAWLIRPVVALQAAAARLADGDLSARARFASADELGALAGSFDRMAEMIERRTDELRAQYAAAEEARAAAEVARAQVSDQLATIERQRAVISEMSVPILPLGERTLVMPLVGALDSARMQQAQERALAEIQHVQAKHLILDITGVPVVDTLVAQGLIQIVQSARLLGSRVLLAGIRPEVAQAIVGLGLTLDDIATRSTLERAVAETLITNA